MKGYKLLLSSTLFILANCGTTTPVALSGNPNTLTQGSIQLNLKKGVTTKIQVLEAFGSPNITTRDAQEREVWTYQRQAQSQQASNSQGFFTLFLLGKSKSSSGSSSSSRMATLIIKFNAKDVVHDFSSRISNF